MFPKRDSWLALNGSWFLTMIPVHSTLEKEELLLWLADLGQGIRYALPSLSSSPFYGSSLFGAVVLALYLEICLDYKDGLSLYLFNEKQRIYCVNFHTMSQRLAYSLA